MQTVARLSDGRTVRFVKGAPEIVLEMCDDIAGSQTREHVNETLAGYQSKAMRTLGFACRKEDGKLVFMGVVGIADPIRDDVKEAIETCKDKAGVRVIIVTGDTPGTANEIGRQIGLIGDDEPDQTITGPEFAALSEEAAKDLVADPSFKIISRARPEDKARLVRLLQANNEVVAVTGDGTNDAPALSKAHVGLSMGDGTSRAKEASDITIIDNSFSSINKAIMWGRSLYLNIRRFIIFQMTINLCACLIVLLGSFIGLDSPLTVTQMLWVNLLMDTFAAMALSSLPADRKVLNDKIGRAACGERGPPPV
jgi:Ca2+-transporting ATPase